MPPTISKRTGCCAAMPERAIRHAVVTGASGGIGGAIVTRLRQQGTNVAGVGRDLARLSEAHSQTLSGEFHAIVADLADPAAPERIAVELGLTELDLLVHAAGRYHRRAVESDDDDLEQQLAVNLVGPARITRLLLPIIERALGQIAFVNSSAARGAHPLVGGYAATKAGLRAYADSLRAEVNPVGIRVVSIFPGRTDTPMQRSIHDAEGRSYDPSRLLAADDVARALLNALDMPGSAEITDILIRPRRASA